jgi:hypothetical protein
MRRTALICSAVLLMSAAPTGAALPHAEAEPLEGVIVGMPVPIPLFRGHADLDGLPDAADDTARHVPEDRSVAVRVFPGVNLTAMSLRLENDWESERGLFIVGNVANAGTVALPEFVCRFYLGDPEAGGVQVGSDVVVSGLRPNSVERVSVPWEGFTGSDALHFVVDPDDEVEENRESDNSDTLAVTLVAGVPWVWQAVNGYCNYASLAMVFNHHGAGNTVYEAVELAACPYSPFYIDDKFVVQGGILSCQAESDYDIAGDIRNLDCGFSIAANWPLYMNQLRSRLDSGKPVLTGVDPYHLPQPDYDWLEAYGVHSGHAVVVTGYTDSSVIINDPGVGLPEYPDPMPDPELRGADVVVGMDAYRMAVEQTLGTPYVLISYTPVGPMPSVDEMLSQVVERDIARLDGDPSAYPELSTIPWPPGWHPHFGAAAFPVAEEDMLQATFEARFDEIAAQTGYDLGATLNVLASQFATGFLWQAVSWDAGRVFYETQTFVGADELASLSGSLAALGNGAFESAIEMVIAIGDAGGNPAVASPYLEDISAALESMAALELSVRDVLESMLSPESSEPAESLAHGASVEPLLAARPNPFSATTEIVLAGAAFGDGPVVIYDASGRVVRRLGRGELSPPGRAYVWDGAGDDGQRAASGVYFAVDSAGRAAKLVKLK